MTISACAVLLSAASCSIKYENEPMTDNAVPMELSANIPAVKTSITPENTVVWSAGDAISVFDGVANRQFDITVGVGTISASFSGEAVAGKPVYYALYPYAGSASFDGTSIISELPSVQYSRVAGTFDTMLAPAVATTDGNGNLNFQNVAGLVKIEFENMEDKAISEISLSAGQSMTGKYAVDMIGDILVAEPVPDEAEEEVRLVVEDGNLLAGPYYLVILPGTYSDVRVSIVFDDGTGMEGTVGSLDIKAGKIASAVIDLADTADSLYEVYDVYYENGKAAGIVFWVSEDSRSALVVSLDRSGTVAWSEDGTHTIGTGQSDGAANTLLCRESEEVDDIPALAFCDAHGEGWYWPAMTEMLLLYETYNGTGYTEGGNVVPAQLSDEEKASRKKFDDLLISNGGIALNTAAADANGDEYWTSTEQTFENVVYGSAFRFGKAYASGGGDKMTKTNSTRRYVRCMKSVQTTDAAIND